MNRSPMTKTRRAVIVSGVVGIVTELHWAIPVEIQAGRVAIVAAIMIAWIRGEATSGPMPYLLPKAVSAISDIISGCLEVKDIFILCSVNSRPSQSSSHSN